MRSTKTKRERISEVEYFGEALQIPALQEPLQKKVWGIRVKGKNIPVFASAKSETKTPANLRPYNGLQVRVNGILDGGQLFKAKVRGIKERFQRSNIKKIIVINERHTVTHVTSTSTVSIEGHFYHDDGGLSFFDKQCVLIGFEGVIKSPKGILIQLNFGVTELARAVINQFSDGIERSPKSKGPRKGGKFTNAEEFYSILSEALTTTGRDFYFGPDPSSDPAVLHHRKKQSEAKFFHSVNNKVKIDKAILKGSFEDVGRLIAKKVALAPTILRPMKVALTIGAIKSVQMDHQVFKKLSESQLAYKRDLHATEEAVRIEILNQKNKLVNIAKRSIKKHVNNPSGNIPEAVLALFKIADSPIVSIQALSAVMVVAAAALITMIAGCSPSETTGIIENDAETKRRVSRTIKEMQGVDADLEGLTEAEQLTVVLKGIGEIEGQIEEANVGSETIEELRQISATARSIEDSRQTTADKVRRLRVQKRRLSRLRDRAGLPDDHKKIKHMQLNDPKEQIKEGIKNINLKQIAKAFSDLTERGNYISRKGRSDISKRFEAILKGYQKGIVPPGSDDSLWG